MSAQTHPQLSASEIPQAGGQWKVRRLAEHVKQRGGGEWVWIWEQAFDQGRQAATDFWARASAVHLLLAFSLIDADPAH